MPKTFRGHPAAAPLTRLALVELQDGLHTFRGHPAAAPLTPKPAVVNHVASQPSAAIRPRPH